MLTERVVFLALGGTLLGAPLWAQHRVLLPPPDSSRAPFLTAMKPDSIRHHTALLHVAELLQSLQSGDANAGGIQLRDATLSLGVCGEVAEAFTRAIDRVRKITRSDGGTSLALFFDRVAITDSGTTQVITADLILMSNSRHLSTRNSVRLVFDPERAVWIGEFGLINALCSL
jgi:hypothetical protein